MGYIAYASECFSQPKCWLLMTLYIAFFVALDTNMKHRFDRNPRFQHFRKLKLKYNDQRVLYANTIMSIVHALTITLISGLCVWEIITKAKSRFDKMEVPKTRMEYIDQFSQSIMELDRFEDISLIINTVYSYGVIFSLSYLISDAATYLIPYFNRDYSNRLSLLHHVIVFASQLMAVNMESKLYTSSMMFISASSYFVEISNCLLHVRRLAILYDSKLFYFIGGFFGTITYTIMRVPWMIYILYFAFWAKFDIINAAGTAGYYCVLVAISFVVLMSIWFVILLVSSFKKMIFLKVVKDPIKNKQE